MLETWAMIVFAFHLDNVQQPMLDKNYAENVGERIELTINNRKIEFMFVSSEQLDAEKMETKQKIQYELYPFQAAIQF